MYMVTIQTILDISQQDCVWNYVECKIDIELETSTCYAPLWDTHTFMKYIVSCHLPHHSGMVLLVVCWSPNATKTRNKTHGEKKQSAQITFKNLHNFLYVFIFCCGHGFNKIIAVVGFQGAIRVTVGANKRLAYFRHVTAHRCDNL